MSDCLLMAAFDGWSDGVDVGADVGADAWMREGGLGRG